ncbi:MAG: methylenetetrahydrofolate reductase [Actinomycetota bacterium]
MAVIQFITDLHRQAKAAGRPALSIEFFPPKTDEGERNLFERTLPELLTVKPLYCSVTYGAGGTTRQRTQELVSWIRRETTITPMAHLTCQGHRRSEIASILDDYSRDGIENILALGGDPPKDATDEVPPSDYRYASELLDDVLVGHRFSVGVAAHPEVHPRSPDRVSDRRFLAAKLSRADFAITQFFFDVEVYVRLCEELHDLGVTKPVVPGIMPVTNKSQIVTMARMSGAAFPTWLADRLDGVDDPDDVRRIGVDAATALSRDLLDAGAPGLHFYTLNRSTATREIYANLGLLDRQ